MNLNAVQIAALIKDQNLRLETLYKIVDKKRQSIRLVPNAIQRAIRASQSKKKMILKARQFGVTTDAVIRLLDSALFLRNQNCCIIAHEQDSIKKIFSIARYAHQELPPPFNFELDRGGGSRYEMRFPQRNSKMYCDLASRSDTISKLHVSEAAFVKDPDQILATMQTVPIDGEICLESTPNGFNWYRDLWIEDNEFEKMFYPWFCFEDYKIPAVEIDRTKEEIELSIYAMKAYGLPLSDEQIAFRRSKQRELKHLFIQEYPEDDASCFLASGASAMDLAIVSELLKKCQKIESQDGLKIFEKFNAKGLYVCGADTAEGYEGDYCAAVMIDCTTRRQVATLHGHFKPSEFARRLGYLCGLYAKDQSHTPLLAVERNLHGHAVLLELSEHIHYNNLFVDQDEKLGWKTDMVSRPVMINGFIDAVENQSIHFQDEAILKECLTLVRKDGKVEAESGKHDDLIFAASIAVQMYIRHGSWDLYDNIEKYIRV